LGFLVGVGGVATRPEATRAAAMVREVPLERMVLETDAPYIGTALSPKGRVEPADLPEIAAAVARLKGVGVDKVAAVTTANARRLLRLEDR
jgi:TatD DNase family protein